MGRKTCQLCLHLSSGHLGKNGSGAFQRDQGGGQTRPEFRGQGLATQVLAHCAEVIRDRGDRLAILFCSDRRFLCQARLVVCHRGRRGNSKFRGSAIRKTPLFASPVSARRQSRPPSGRFRTRKARLSDRTSYGGNMPIGGAKTTTCAMLPTGVTKPSLTAAAGGWTDHRSESGSSMRRACRDLSTP